MDTNLGKIELTEKQIQNLNSLKSENIKGFCYWHDKKEVVVVSDTAVDEKALKSLIASLPDEDSAEVKEQKAKAELDALIEAKKREFAISELKKEGLLDSEAKITVSGKASLSLGKVG